MKSKSMFRTATLLGVITWAAACGTNSQTVDAGNDIPASCTVIDSTTCTMPPPSFTSDVTPVLDRACNSTCHAPGVGPWPLVTYSDVSDWASIIQADIVKCSMPPADAGAGNGTLSDSERAMLLDWLACGAPNN